MKHNLVGMMPLPPKKYNPKNGKEKLEIIVVLFAENEVSPVKCSHSPKVVLNPELMVSKPTHFGIYNG